MSLSELLFNTMSLVESFMVLISGIPCCYGHLKKSSWQQGMFQDLILHVYYLHSFYNAMFISLNVNKHRKELF